MYKNLRAVLALGSLLLLFGCSSQLQPEPPLLESVVSNHVLEVRIAASSDDAEESVSGGVTRASIALELVRTSAEQTVGLRFTGLTVPAGATITHAYVQFTAKTATSEVTNLSFQAQAADNPASFSGALRNVSTRARTTAAVAWSPAAWTAGAAGAAQQTPDLAPVLQEVVARSGWSSGNALALIITGTGRRVALPYDGSPADAPLLHVEYSDGGGSGGGGTTPTLEARVAASTDDAEESVTNGGVNRSSTTLELIRSTTEQTVGLRFADLALPRGVAVTNAYIQFKASKTTSEATSLTLEGQAGDNPPSFSGVLYNVSARARTTATVTWTPAAWTSGAAGAAQRTPNLAPIIQEIVSRPGWRSGNALALLITGTGQRVGWSYDGDQAAAPLLHIEYSTTDSPPSVDRFSAAPGTAVKGQQTRFSWSVSDPEGNPLRCTLDADGDGTTDYTISDCHSTTSQAHTYTRAGRYWPTLTVTDSKNATDMATLSFHVTNTTSVTVAAAGDIACKPTDGSYQGGAGTATRCHMNATSSLVRNLNPEAVFTLGDQQYSVGALADFLQVYDQTWGQYKDVTYPAAGTHEYQSGSAAGYFAYFGAAAGDPAKGYYSYDLGAWHVVVLNTSCPRIGGCGSGSAQERWLQADLAAHPQLCTLAVMHYPRFSSGKSGNIISGIPFWRDLYAAGVEFVLSGNDHHYERFAPQTPDGVLDSGQGVRQFIVGTGGKELYALNAPQPNSEVRIANTFGVLKLELQPTGYTWQFVPEAGKTGSDNGSSTCH